MVTLPFGVSGEGGWSGQDLCHSFTERHRTQVSYFNNWKK